MEKDSFGRASCLFLYKSVLKADLVCRCNWMIFIYLGLFGSSSWFAIKFQSLCVDKGACFPCLQPFSLQPFPAHVHVAS